jgi:DNA topoisomerase-3
LYAAGLARARADWLVGMSATRALSLMAQKKGYRGVLSVGRVQTPTLAIVVNRDIEIENFKPKDYYDITGIFSNVVAQWIPARNTDSDVVVVDDVDVIDVEGRCISEQYAKNITENILNNNHAVVENFTTQRKKVPPLLLHSIDTLQEQANKKFGFSSKQTLDLAQSLYEKHKAVTYPRSDCQYLPISQLSEVKNVMTAISSIDGNLSELIANATNATNADLAVRSKVIECNKSGGTFFRCVVKFSTTAWLLFKIRRPRVFTKGYGPR